MFSMKETGKGMTMGNLTHFRSGLMYASGIGTKNAAKKIAKEARKNLKLMAMRRHGTTGVPMEKGIGFAKAGKNNWVVYSAPVPDGVGGQKMPAAFEFGRGPLSKPPADGPLWFRQKGVFRQYSGPVPPRPYFRQALAMAKDTTVNEINKGMRGLIS